MTAPAHSNAGELPSLEIPAIAELASIRQWVGWKAPEKIPLQPNGKPAKSNDPETWSSFTDVAQNYVGGFVDGVGFVFSREDDYVGVDFDGCLDQSLQITDPEVAAWVEKLNSYTEISPSGHGLHVLTQGTIPHSVKTDGVEIYDQGRYFTITGRHFPGTPTAIEWREEEIKALHAETVARRKTQDSSPTDGRPGPIKPGARHERILSRGREIWKKGLREEELRGALHGFNKRQCDPPLPEVEVDKIIAWIIREVDRPTTKPKREFRFLAFNDVEAELCSRGLIKGVMDLLSMVVIYGLSGSSKTFLALLMALCVAAGRRFFGRKVQQGMAIYIAAEGARGISKRVAAYRQELLKNAVDVRFHLLTTAVNFLDAESDVVPLIEAIQELERKTGHRCALVVIDTLSRAMPAGNENASQDMTTVIANGDRLRHAVGCSLVWVHHAGKDEAKGARGHSSLRAATDTEIEVKELGGGFFEMRVTKQRELEAAANHTYQLKVVELGVDEDGEAVTTCVPVETAEAPVKKQRGKLNARGKILEQCMRQLFAANTGVPIPEEARNAFPQGIQAGQQSVSISALQEVFYRRLGEDPDTRDSSRDSLRSIFSRTQQAAQAAGQIAVFDGYVWFLD